MADAMNARHDAPTVRESLQEYGRGLAGGLLFSLPLLYTMEMWWAGFIADPQRLIILIAFTFVLLLGYNRFAGLHEGASWAEVAIDSVEELGLGIVTATIMLYLLGRIGPGYSSHEVIGKIVVEASVVAIGYSVGTAQLNAGDNESGRKQNRRRANPPARFARELVIAFCGAVLFAANIAPTEEILMIAAETRPVRLIGLVALSILTASIILYFSNFARSDSVLHRDSPSGFIVGSSITYAVAVIASALILWFFGRFAGASLEMVVSQTVVLGFPATLGSSAGRLLIAQ